MSKKLRFGAIILLITLLAATVFISGCSSDSTDDSSAYVRIEISPGSVNMNIGQTQQFTATAITSDNGTEDVTNEVIWSSLDESVAPISNTGLVTAQTLGTSQIRAEFIVSSLSATATVAVVEVPPATDPVVQSITPAVGGWGTEVTINGENFGDVQDRALSTVTFGGIEVGEYVSWSDTQLVVVIPPTCNEGAVVVTVDGVASNNNVIFDRTRAWQGAMTIADFGDEDSEACHSEMACDVNGNTILVFVNNYAEGSYWYKRIYASRFDAITGEWSDPVPISPDPVLIEPSGYYYFCRPRVAMDHAGNAVAVFVEDEEYLCYNTYNAENDEWGSVAEPQYVDPDLVDLGDSHCHGEIGMDAAGNAYCVYKYWDLYGIRFARYDAESGEWTDHRQLATGTGSSDEYCDAFIAVNVYGDAIVSFCYDDGDVYPLMARTYTSGEWSPIETISNYEDDWQGGSSSVAINNNGDGIVAFPSWDYTGTYKYTCANRFVGGAWQGSETIVSEEVTGEESGGPSAAIDQDGNCMVSFNMPCEGDVDRKVYASYYNGTEWDGPDQISANGVPGCASMLSQFDDLGNVALIYKQIDNPDAIPSLPTGGGAHGRIYISMFDGTLGEWLPRETVDAGYGEAYADRTVYQYMYCRPRVCMDYSGNVAATFVQYEYVYLDSTTYTKVLGNRYW